MAQGEGRGDRGGGMAEIRDALKEKGKTEGQIKGREEGKTGEGRSGNIADPRGTEKSNTTTGDPTANDSRKKNEREIGNKL